MTLTLSLTLSIVCDANKEDIRQACDSKILLCGHMGHMMAGDYFWRLFFAHETRDGRRLLLTPYFDPVGNQGPILLSWILKFQNWGGYFEIVCISKSCCSRLDLSLFC